MRLSDSDIEQVIEHVKKAPCTVQEVSEQIGKSWVTTEKYLNQIKEKTGLINLRTFRPGTQAALKIVYYTPNELSLKDDIQKSLAYQLLNGRQKTDFDFMDVFQFIPTKEKYSFTRTVPEEKHMTIGEVVKQPAKKKVFYFSGNMSFVSTPYKGKGNTVDLMEKQLENGVQVKILCRVSLSSLSNIEKVSKLLVKYPDQFEIRHRYHPLRGMIIDDDFARFKSWEEKDKVRQGELAESTRIYYEINSKEWVSWMESLFWKMWRSSIPYDQRIKELKQINEK